MEHLSQNKFSLAIILSIVVSAAIVTLYIVKKADLPSENNPAMESLSILEGVEPYTDMSGNEVSLVTEVGKILIINSWASWSPSSASDLKILTSVAEEFENDEVSVVAINRAEDSSVAERFLTFHKVRDKVKLVLDPDDTYYKSIQGYAMPETVIYDYDGNIVSHIRGDVKEEEVKNTVRNLIKPSDG